MVRSISQLSSLVDLQIPRRSWNCFDKYFYPRDGVLSVFKRSNSMFFLQLRGVLAGCKESFMDFKIPDAIYKSSDGSGAIGTPVRLAGDSGVVVGEPGDRLISLNIL